MDIPRPDGPTSGAQRYCWTVELPRRPRLGRKLDAAEMNASEQMFFLGAPLAHVVAYEASLRQSRAERSHRIFMRGRRVFDRSLTEADVPAEQREVHA